MLPKYLQCHYDGTALSSQIVYCGNARFTVLTDRLLRLEQGASFTDNATITVINRKLDEAPFTATEENGVLTIETEFLRLSYRIGTEFSADTLSVSLLKAPRTTWCYGEIPEGNLGGTTITLDQINGACPIDDGICSRSGAAVMDDSTAPRMLPDGWFGTRGEGLKDVYFFGYGHDYTTCVKDYYRLTGVPELLPAYAMGNWWSRYFRYTEDSYLALMDNFRDHDIPLSVGIVDMDWHHTDGGGVRDYRQDGWTGYSWNKEYFPNPARFLKGIHDRNLHTALNLHPAGGVREWEDQYEEMATFMGQDPAKKEPVPFNCLSKKFWQAYFEILHFPHERDGVDFWWMDWQQGFDYAWIRPYDSTVRELECMSPLWMVNHMHYLAAKRDGKRGMIFSRYAGFGSQRYPIGFSGDTVISWDSLNFQPYFTATASNIGYSYWSHDIGGHMSGYRDDELNTRWIQFGVFSPIFRMHSTDSVFTGREPWLYNKRAELTVADFMRLRHRLFPYIYTMAHRNCTELVPLMRPMYHTHPEEAAAYTVPNQYWFGSQLIAAPITEKADPVTDRAKTTVWLPEGKWVDWFTGYVYDGGETVEMYRPMEQLPLLCKAGAIVPLQRHRVGDNRLGLGDAAEVVIAAGANGEFTLYEDDGETQNYKTGDFCTTRMTLDWTPTAATFTVQPAQGNTALVPTARDYTLTFKGFAKGTTFAVTGKALPAQYDAATNTYTVTVEGVATAQGVAVTAQHASALMSDNSDCLARILDLLTRSQCTINEKDWWHNRVKWVLERGVITGWHFASETQNSLGGAIYELLHQVVRRVEMEPAPGIPLPKEE